MSSHTNFQIIFRENLKANVNPCNLLWEIRKGEIVTPKGYETKGYDIKYVEQEPFVAEVDRPSPFQEGKWVIPRMVAEALLDIDGHPMNLLDLYTEMKERFPNIEDRDIKEYAILLGEGGVVDLRNAKEKEWAI